MNLHIDIGHPGHVHFFKHAVRIWREHGHRVFMTTRRIPIAMHLLDVYGLEYAVVSTKRTGAFGLGVELVEHAARLLPRLLREKADVAMAIGGTFTVHAGLLAGCRRIVFYDTDTATTANRITYPFAGRIVTPDVYPHDLGRKHVRYGGFHELAYLHPNYFTPRPEVLGKYGLNEGEPFSIVRFIAWEASHDIGVDAASRAEKEAVVEWLRGRVRVLVLPERTDDPLFPDLTVRIAPEDFHDLLYYASFCATEGATTASECCILGTPVLYMNPLQPCYIHTMAETGLLAKVLPGEPMVPALEALQDRYGDADAARDAAARLVADHIDVTDFMVRFVEGEAG